MSLEETARITCGCEGKSLSISRDCWNAGSLVEKKKFSSTTGFRSTKNATSASSTPVIASISQCAPGQSSSFFRIDDSITGVKAPTH